MDFSLEIEEDSGFLLALVAGVRTPQSVAAAAAQVVAECVKRQAACVLIDVRKMSGSLSTLESFEVVSKGFGERSGQRPLMLKAAIIDLPESLERLRFFETAARNRGYNLRCFGDFDLAVEWLRGG